MTNTETLARRDLNVGDKPVTFKPFGAADEIKLSVEIIQNFVAVPTKSGRTCSKRDAIKFLMLCQAQRLNPFAGDAYLVGYDSRDAQGNITPTFSLITAHQALLKRAEASSDYEGMESGIILIDEAGKVSEREGDFHTEDEKVIGGWAKVYRKGRKPTYKRLAISQRRPKYDSQFWQGNKASEQVVKCAESDALRATFPTLIGGLYIEGEQDVRADKFISEVTSDRNGGGFDARGLVESGPMPAPTTGQAEHRQRFTDEGEDTDLGPQPATDRAKPQSAQTAQAPSAVKELEDLVLSNGYSFSHLQRFGLETENIEGADSMGGFSEVPESVAKRLLRAKSGLLSGLAAVKAKG